MYYLTHIFTAWLKPRQLDIWIRLEDSGEDVVELAEILPLPVEIPSLVVECH